MIFGKRRGTGKVHLDATGRRWNGKLILSGVRDGEHQTRASGDYVSLRGRQGTAVFSVADPREAERALAAAGLDSHRTRIYHLRKVGMTAGAAVGAAFLAFFMAIPLVAVIALGRKTI